MKTKPELVSFSDFLMVAPFFDLRAMFAPEIEYLRNGIDGLLQSGLINKEEDESDLIEYHDSVAVITIEGPMRPGRDWYFSVGYGDIQDAIVELIDKPEIKTVIQLMKTPGGTVAQAFETEEMFKELAKEKTLISAIDIATSAGALMTFPASQRYLVSKTAQTGSIGIVAEHVDSRDWYREFLGEVRTSVAKGDMKDAGTDTRGYDEKAKLVFTEAVDKLYDIFAESATVGLKISREKIDGMQSRVYIGSDGITQGFAQGFATLDQLIEANQNQTSSSTFFTPGRPALSNIQTEEKRMDIKQFEAEHLDVYRAVIKKGGDEREEAVKQEYIDQGKAVGTLAERKRMNDIDALGFPTEFAKKAKESDWSAEKAAYEFQLAEAKAKSKVSEDMKSEMNEGLKPDAPEAPTAPNKTEASKTDTISKFDAEVAKVMANGKSKGDAMKLVKAAFPKLHTEWLDAINSQEGGE